MICARDNDRPLFVGEMLADNMDGLWKLLPVFELLGLLCPIGEDEERVRVLLSEELEGRTSVFMMSFIDTGVCITGDHIFGNEPGILAGAIFGL